MVDERSEAFDRFVDTLLSGGRPSPDQVVDEEGPMAQLAAELSAAADPDQGEPDAAFIEQLRLRMRDADAGIAAVQDWVLPGDVQLGRARITRRDLLRLGIGAAGGLAAAAAATAILRAGSREPIPSASESPSDGQLVGDGQWVEVASLADLPVGAALRFSTTALDGYVVNDAGTIRALSAVCTHQACTLIYRQVWHDLRCPCHGASFDLSGKLANGREGWAAGHGYLGDSAAYPLDLPPLARPRVRVLGDSVQVWTALA